MASELWNSDRPEFIERIASLAGGTTYREPVGGHSTKSEHLPDAHAIAAALAFSRRGPDDVGPDVAYCWVLQTDAYRERVVDRVCRALTKGNNRPGRAADDLAMAVGAAWDSLVWNKPTKRPANIPQKAWDVALLFAVKVLYDSAWDSLAEAERAYRGRATA